MEFQQPTEQDEGKNCKVCKEDGKWIDGYLFIDDLHFNGEDEYPAFHVRFKDGKANSIHWFAGLKIEGREAEEVK